MARADAEGRLGRLAQEAERASLLGFGGTSALRPPVTPTPTA